MCVAVIVPIIYTFECKYVCKQRAIVQYENAGFKTKYIVDNVQSDDQSA